MDINELTDRIYLTVKNHALEPGRYARWLWQNEEGTRKLGNNEYGCADAANILYSIGRFPQDPDERAACVKALQAFQDAGTGLFYEGTHHAIHCTAHCIAALELFDARPLWPLNALAEQAKPNAIGDFLNGLDWERTAWSQAHQGAGIFAAFILTGNASHAWQDAYFDWLTRNADPEFGISRRGAVQAGLLRPSHHLFGWFHYLFNFSFARRPFPFAERIVDTCIDLYKSGDLSEDFGRSTNFMEIDWIYSLNRAAVQSGHRLAEARDCLREFARQYIPDLLTIDWQRHEDWNDLRMLFGAVCALAELQQALPGELLSDYPLKLVLDRRPFI